MSISDNKCKNYSYMASDLRFPRLVQVTAAPLDDACGSTLKNLMRVTIVKNNENAIY